jgi:hypothetical protein
VRVEVRTSIVSISVTVFVCAGDPESRTRNVIEAFATAAVGVPEITPDVDKDSPAGRVPPEIDQVNGTVPPLATTDAL